MAAEPLDVSIRVHPLRAAGHQYAPSGAGLLVVVIGLERR
jgi:hypothetical protein